MCAGRRSRPACAPASCEERRGPGHVMAAQALLTADAAPPRVVAALAELLPGDVRLDGISLRYADQVEVELRVAARTPSSFDLFLDRLQRSPSFAGVLPGEEDRRGQMRADDPRPLPAGEPVNRGLLAAFPLAFALVLYAALALPLRARTERAHDAFAQARRDRLQAQSQLAPLERQERIRRQAEAAFAEAAAQEGGAAAAIRRSVLATLEEGDASAVRLGVRPGAGGPTLRRQRLRALRGGAAPDRRAGPPADGSRPPPRGSRAVPRRSPPGRHPGRSAGVHSRTVNGRIAVILAAGAALLGLSFLVAPRPDPAVPRPPRRLAADPRPAPRETPAAGTPERNVFEYEEPAAPRATPAPRPVPIPSAEPPPSDEPVAPAAVRLVGLVRRGGALRAAVSIRGTVVILGVGEEAEGYRVVSIDEEAGVRLTGPDGAEQSLAPAAPLAALAAERHGEDPFEDEARRADGQRHPADGCCQLSDQFHRALPPTSRASGVP